MTVPQAILEAWLRWKLKAPDAEALLALEAYLGEFEPEEVMQILHRLREEGVRDPRALWVALGRQQLTRSEHPRP